MANIPIQSTTGDPVFRSQSSSISAIRNLSRAAADASIKLNSQERIVTPGDDALSFSTSRRIRSNISSLRTVSETGQLNVTGLGLAVDSLEGIKGQLDDIKKKIVQSQVADDSERAGIQAEIDLALGQIDSSANNTKLGSRSLLNGDSTIGAVQSINAAGTVTDFAVNQGQSLTQTAGVQGVRVNKVGTGGATRTLNDGSNVLSLNVSILSSQKATRATVLVNANGGNANDFIELRVTGKLGSTTIRFASTPTDFDDVTAQAAAFNSLAEQTGVVLTSDTSNSQAVFTTVGFGGDEFIKVELINSGGTGGNTPSVSTGGNTITGAAQNGTVLTSYGQGATARVNGQEVALGGENGTTARFLNNGFDVEIDFATTGLTENVNGDANANISDQINVDLTQGVVGLLGTSGGGGDTIQYGYGNFTTANLGRGNAQYLVTTASSGGQGTTGLTGTNLPINGGAGNQIVGGGSVADLGSGGSLSLSSGRITEALRTVDRAIGQTIDEQTRLGTIQGNFIDAINRAETSIGNLAAAEADIIGVDAATEITNLVQSQLGISTASSVLSQANAIQATVASLLRG